LFPILAVGDTFPFMIPTDWRVEMKAMALAGADTYKESLSSAQQQHSK